MEKENNKEGKVKSRNDIPEKYKWNIEAMYESEEAWQKDYEEVSKLLQKITEFAGRLGESASTLLETLKLKDELNKKAENLFVFSKMKKDEDNRISKYQALYDKATALSVKIGGALSFIVPEILSIDEKTIDKFLKENEELRLYKFYLEELLRQKEHVLSEAEEKILAMMGEVSLSPKNIFTMLNNADIKFPIIKDDKGNKIELTKGNFIKFLENKDRRVRKDAFKGFYKSYINLQNTYGATLISSLKKDIFHSRVRKYNSALEASLDDDNIPVSVYDNLIKTIHERMDLMHRYVKLRKKALNLDELYMYDLYTPLVSEDREDIDYDEAVQMVKEGLKPLGDEYISIMDKAFKEGWIDVFENEGKTSGAYSWGTYTSNPYILLNYQDTINDVFTLAHEMGHSMHTYYSNKNQPYIYSGYKIFVAEVASTVNESILMNDLLKKTKDKKKRLYLLNHFLEQFRGTVYRQTMFAEFEKEIHGKLEKGEALTTDLLCELYYSLNQKYYGSDICVDDEIKYEWARIPHFYNPFYVYKYATGFSAAVALSQKILNEGSEAVSKYIDFLKSGGSDYPLNLLKKAGVDMTTPKPINDALDVFESLLNEIETLLS